MEMEEEVIVKKIKTKKYYYDQNFKPSFRLIALGENQIFSIRKMSKLGFVDNFHIILRKCGEKRCKLHYYPFILEKG